MSVLQVPEVPGSRNDQGGCEDGQPQGQARTSAIQAQESAGPVTLSSSLPDNRPRQSSCRHQSRHLKDGLFEGEEEKKFIYSC